MAINSLTNMINQNQTDFVSDFLNCFDENCNLISAEKSEYCFWIINNFLTVNFTDNYYQQKLENINQTMNKLKEEISKRIKGNFDCVLVEVYFRVKDLYRKRILSVTPQMNVTPQNDKYPMGMGSTTYNNNFEMFKDK